MGADKKYEDLWDDIDLAYPETYNDNYSSRELTAGNTEMTVDFSRRDMKLAPLILFQIKKKDNGCLWFKRNETVLLDSTFL